MKKNQSGFGAIGILFVIVIILLGVMGYLVYKNHHNKSTTTNAATAISNNPALSANTTSTPKVTVPAFYSKHKIVVNGVDFGIDFDTSAQVVGIDSNVTALGGRDFNGNQMELSLSLTSAPTSPITNSNACEIDGSKINLASLTAAKYIDTTILGQPVDICGLTYGAGIAGSNTEGTATFQYKGNWYMLFFNTITPGLVLDPTTLQNVTESITTSGTSTGQDSSSPSSSSSILKIPELGIELINIPSSLSGLTYAVRTPVEANGVNDAVGSRVSVNISTSSLTSADSICSAAQGSGIGLLTLTDGTSNDYANNGAQVAQFSGFTVGYGHPQSACSDNTATESLHLSQTQTFETFANNPANIKLLQ